MPTPAELFAQLEDRVRAVPNKTVGMNALYRFDLTGEGGGTWWLRFVDGLPQVGEGEPPSTPDVVQTMTAEDYVALATGEANGQELFFSGRMKVNGDGFLGMKLGQIFQD